MRISEFYQPEDHNFFTFLINQIKKMSFIALLTNV
jgi:hypothetical protein